VAVRVPYISSADTLVANRLADSRASNNWRGNANQPVRNGDSLGRAGKARDPQQLLGVEV